MIKNIILDTKVFVLFIIGSIDRSYIEKFIRTKEFTAGDYDLLVEKIGNFESIFITSHILTEFSHFTFEERYFRDDYKKILKNILVDMHDKKKLNEKQICMSKIFSHDKVYYLGVADVSLMELCTKDCVVVTSDGPLADKLREEGKIALKFIPTLGFVNY